MTTHAISVVSRKTSDDGTIEVLSQLDPSWSERPSVWRKLLSRLLKFDAVVLAVFDPKHPTPDTFLLADGFQRGQLLDWCTQGFQDDQLFRHAVDHGVKMIDQAQGFFTGPALAVTLPACYERKTIWYFACARESEPFTDHERRIAITLLRTLAARFEFATEAGLGRILLNDHYDLLYADPISCLRFVEREELMTEIATVLPAVTNQRWPQLLDHQMHSVYLSLDDHPTWVRFCRGCADHSESRHWYLELRLLDADDPPPIGYVEDDRVAQALAYLTDHFQESPVLADVAEHVNTSPFHFHRLFSSQAGISPKHFLLRTQLLHAKQLLRATRMPIGNIAKAAGFASHGHFTATFNRIVGLNPSDYREQS